MRSLLVPALAAGAVVAAVTAGGLLLAGPPGPDGEPRLGAALSARDRAVVAAPLVGRGAEAVPADPAVDPTDPAAVARAYLVAAHSARPDDADRTHLRAAGYAVPGTPPAAVGILVLDAPPAGTRRVAEVTALELAAADRGNRRRGYVATVRTSTAGGPPVDRARYVVLARTSGERWLVAAESPATRDLPAGEG